MKSGQSNGSDGSHSCLAGWDYRRGAHDKSIIYVNLLDKNRPHNHRWSGNRCYALGNNRLCLAKKRDPEIPNPIHKSAITRTIDELIDRCSLMRFLISCHKPLLLSRNNVYNYRKAANTFCFVFSSGCSKYFADCVVPITIMHTYINNLE